MPAIPLSPERQRLAQSIERHAAATAHVERVRGAKLKAWQIGGADAVDAAERVLVQARQAETTAVLADLLDNAAPSSLTVAAATVALAEARAARDTAEQARTALLREEELAAGRLRAAEAERAAAIGTVVRADPVFAAVFAEFAAAQQRVADLRAIVQLLPGKTPAEANHVLFVTQRDGSGRGLAQFKTALAALESDPAAPLPDALFVDDPAAAAA